MDKPKPDAYPDEARVIVDDVIRALSGGIGPRFDEMWERIGEWMREEVAFCAACHSDPIDALVKDRDDARRELAETKARLAALESASLELANALPRCAGKWVGGSGGHAILEPCSRIATVFNTDCIYGQTCDEHRSLIERGADDAIWAELATEAAAKVFALVPTDKG